MSKNPRVVVVTGGASGIGSAVVDRLTELGDTVLILDQDERGARAKQEAGLAAGNYACDLTAPETVTAAVAGVLADHDRVDVLVNCAGLARLGPAEELSLADWDLTLDVNLRGTFVVTQAVGQQMIRQGSGRIITIASQAAHIGLTGHLAYCASKAALLGMTRVLALEWGPYGVTSNTISPTVVLTPLGHEFWDNPAGDALKAQIPTRRFAVPEEIAAAVVYLASSDAGMINGADLVIDGGFTVI